MICALFLAAGCSGTFDDGSAGKVVKSDDVTVVTRPADVHAIMFKDVRTDHEKFCVSRMPDSAGTYSEGVSLNVPAAAGSEGVSENAGKGALSLGGRSPSTLITRELLYRACELMMNTNASPEKMEEIFFKVLDRIVEINKAQTEAGAAALGLSSQPAKRNDDDSFDDSDGDDSDGDDSDGDDSSSGGVSDLFKNNSSQ